MGVTDVQFVVADNMNQGEAAATQSRNKAENALNELASIW